MTTTTTLANSWTGNLTTKWNEKWLHHQHHPNESKWTVTTCSNTFFDTRSTLFCTEAEFKNANQSYELTFRHRSHRDYTIKVVTNRASWFRGLANSKHCNGNLPYKKGNGCVCLFFIEIHTAGRIQMKFGTEVVLEGGKVLGGVDPIPPPPE